MPRECMKSFFNLSIIFSQSVIKLEKSNTDSCNMSESTENLHTSTTPSPSAPGIPSFHVQGSLKQYGWALLSERVISGLNSSPQSTVFRTQIYSTILEHIDASLNALHFLKIWKTSCTYIPKNRFMWSFQRVRCEYIFFKSYNFCNCYQSHILLSIFKTFLALI